jgi:hypothetical protein
MSRYLLRRYWWRFLGEPIVGNEIRRPGYPDVYRVTRILPNQPHWGGGVWGVRTGQQETTEPAAEWAAAKVNNLGGDFLSPRFYEDSIYWMRTRFHLSRKMCINILEHSLSLPRTGGGHHLRWKN